MPLDTLKEVSVLPVINLSLRNSPPEGRDTWEKLSKQSINQHRVYGAWVGVRYSGHMLGGAPWVGRAEETPTATSLWVVESLGTL